MASSILTSKMKKWLCMIAFVSTVLGSLNAATTNVPHESIVSLPTETIDYNDHFNKTIGIELDPLEYGVQINTHLLRNKQPLEHHRKHKDKRDLRAERLRVYKTMLKDMKKTGSRIKGIKTSTDGILAASKQPFLQDLGQTKKTLQKIGAVLKMLRDPTSNKQFTTITKIKSMLDGEKDKLNEMEKKIAALKSKEPSVTQSEASSQSDKRQHKKESLLSYCTALMEKVEDIKELLKTSYLNSRNVAKMQGRLAITAKQSSAVRKLLTQMKNVNDDEQYSVLLKMKKALEKDMDELNGMQKTVQKAQKSKVTTTEATVDRMVQYKRIFSAISSAEQKHQTIIIKLQETLGIPPKEKNEISLRMSEIGDRLKTVKSTTSKLNNPKDDTQYTALLKVEDMLGSIMDALEEIEHSLTVYEVTTTESGTTLGESDRRKAEKERILSDVASMMEKVEDTAEQLKTSYLDSSIAGKMQKKLRLIANQVSAIKKALSRTTDLNNDKQYSLMSRMKKALEKDMDELNGMQKTVQKSQKSKVTTTEATVDRMVQYKRIFSAISSAEQKHQTIVIKLQETLGIPPKEKNEISLRMREIGDRLKTVRSTTSKLNNPKDDTQYTALLKVEDMLGTVMDALEEIEHSLTIYEVTTTESGTTLGESDRRKAEKDRMLSDAASMMEKVEDTAEQLKTSYLDGGIAEKMQKKLRLIANQLSAIKKGLSRMTDVNNDKQYSLMSRMKEALEKNLISLDKMQLVLRKTQKTTVATTENTATTGSTTRSPMIPERVEMYERLRLSLLSAQTKQSELQNRTKSTNMIPSHAKAEIFRGLKPMREKLSNVSQDLDQLHNPSAEHQYSVMLQDQKDLELMHHLLKQMEEHMERYMTRTAVALITPEEEHVWTESPVVITANPWINLGEELLTEGGTGSTTETISVFEEEEIGDSFRDEEIGEVFEKNLPFEKSEKPDVDRSKGYGLGVLAKQVGEDETLEEEPEYEGEEVEAKKSKMIPVAIGVMAVVGLLVICISVYCCRCKKKKTEIQYKQVTARDGYGEEERRTGDYARRSDSWR